MRGAYRSGTIRHACLSLPPPLVTCYPSFYWVKRRGEESRQEIGGGVGVGGERLRDRDRGGVGLRWVCYKIISAERANGSPRDKESRQGNILRIKREGGR